MDVALFVTCLNDTLFPRAPQAVVATLERLGHRVEFPLEQTCCGQAHLNSGHPAQALPLMRRFVSVFAGHEAIVCPSGSCAATVKEQYVRLAALAGDPGLQHEVEALAGRVHEYTQFLTDVLGVEDVGARFAHRVAYHPSCHALRVLGVDEGPRRLLRAVRDLELVELPEARTCCGFGGTFSVTNPGTSTAMLTDKLGQLLSTRAEVCTAVDSSCLMHIGGGLSRGRAGMRTMHIAEILAA